MLNLLKSDFYRLIREKQFWVILAILIAISIFAAGMISWVSSPEFAYTVSQQAYENESATMSEAERLELEAEIADDLAENEALNGKVLPSLLYIWDQTMLSGGGVTLIGSLCAALCLVADFKGGFVRNLVASKRGRRKYFCEKLIYIALLQLLVLMISVVSCTVSFAAFGFTYEAIQSPGEIAIWLALTWLLCCAYAYFAACFVWLVHSEALSALVVAFVSTGLLGTVLCSVASFLGNAYPWLLQARAFTLTGCRGLLNNLILLSPNELVPIPDMLPAVFCLVVAGVYCALFVAVSLTWGRKRDW